MNIILKEIKNELTEKKSRFITRLKKINSEKEAETLIHDTAEKEKGEDILMLVMPVMLNHYV